MNSSGRTQFASGGLFVEPSNLDSGFILSLGQTLYRVVTLREAYAHRRGRWVRASEERYHEGIVF